MAYVCGAGDAEFLSRTKNMDVSVAVGEQLSLNGALISRMGNATIRADCALLKFADERLAPSGSRS